MREANRVPVAILAAGGLIAGAVLGAGLLVRDALRQPGPPPTPRRAPGPASSVAPGTMRPSARPAQAPPRGGDAPAMARSRRPPAAASSQALMRLFFRQWQGRFAQQALRKCFRPASKKGLPTDPTPYFRIRISAEGRVERVSYNKGAAKRFPAIYPCVAAIIRKMRFDTGGRALEGDVQASQPGAVRTVRPAGP